MTLTDYARDVQQALAAVDHRQVAALIRVLLKAHAAGRLVFVAGNGGSASSASHLSQDLSKGTVDPGFAGRRFRAVSLVDNVSWMTALANDEGYDRVFEQQLRTLASRGDVLLAISGSGNSPNILNVVRAARWLGVETVGITGFDGGALASLADHVVLVPSDDMGVVESVHTVLFHFVTTTLQRSLRDDAVAASSEAARA